jgi:P-type conjugative transfer protein TrbG
MRRLSTILFASAIFVGSAAQAAAPRPPTAVASPAARTPPSRSSRYPDQPAALTGAPVANVAVATAAARVEPGQGVWLNAMQVYAWTDAALYQIYAAPGRVTDIALQPGEQLSGSGPVAAGDTVRWIIGDTESGPQDARQVHILAKPVASALVTNLVVNTNRRTYHLELRATAEAYMASVSWRYPQDELVAVKAASVDAVRAAPVAQGIELERVNFDYRIDGAKAPWRPLRAFDDGRQVFIEFPPQVATSEMPPLFVIGPKGTADLVNYRVSGRRMIVDRLFAVAELRLGGKGREQRVRIIRTASR